MSVPAIRPQMAPLGLFLVALTFGCAGGPAVSEENASPQATDEDAVVVAVTNNTLARLRVHAMYAGAEPHFLGEVSINRTRAFTFPWSEGELRLGVRRADATVREPRWSQTALSVTPRDSLEFTLTTSDRRTAQIVFRKVGTRQKM